MADRLNDTDPQSPRAFGSRTDPGLGRAVVDASDGPAPEDAPSPVPARAEPPLPRAAAAAEDHSPLPPVPTPSTGTASIEELLNGITGPRPPPSRRESTPSPPRTTPAPASVRATPPPGSVRVTPAPAPARVAPAAGPDADRAYAAARPAPASRPMTPAEPLVVSAPPPPYSSAESARQDSDVPLKMEPESAPPVERRPVEVRTVSTGRRALIRNLAVAVVSAAGVAGAMMAAMRWNEVHHPRGPSEVVVLPPVPDETPTATALPVAAAVAPPETTPEPAPLAAAPVVPIPTVSASAVTPLVKAAPSASAAKRVRADARSAEPPAESLDDLNRQIRH
jgi:hypothetical protein